MTVSIGAVSLSDHLDIVGDINANGIRRSDTPTLGGGKSQYIVSSFGKELVITTVSAGNGFYGKFTRLQGQDIASLRDAGDAVTVIHPKIGTISAVIKEVNLKPWTSSACTNPDDNQWLEGSITIMVV